MKAYARLIAFDFKLYFRDLLTLFWLLIYPLLMLLIFGSMFGDTPGEIAGTRYIDLYVPALCVLNVITVSVFTININMVTLRESGVLRRFRVTPLRASAVLVSHAAQGLFFVICGAIEIIVVAMLRWNIDVSFYAIFSLFLTILIGCVGFFSLGIAMSVLSKTPGAASGIAMIVFFPALFLSGIAMPLDILPQFMQTASKFVPMTYLVNLAQGVWNGESIASFGTEWAVLAGFAVVCCALALRFFRWEKE